MSTSPDVASAADHDRAINSPIGPTIWTIGHSTRAWEEFVALLHLYEILLIADVRLIPQSRRHPHFGEAWLGENLPRAGIEYLGFPALGGRRKAAPDSINTGWRNESFRGYADYMQTPEFAAALESLMEAARQTPAAIMCAEAVPWRCHRNLIADALLARGWTVHDIISEQSATPHKFTPFAEVRGTQVIYPSPQPELFET